MAIGAFLVLLPLAAHSVWDYVEMRRLVHEIEAIQAKGEPVTERQTADGRLASSPGEQGASSYYLAAAVLALGGTDPAPVLEPVRDWLAEPAADREELARLTTPLDGLVERSSDALRLADKASELPFDGLMAGTEFDYRTASVHSLAALVEARTLSLSFARQPDAAVNSVISGLHARRALRATRWPSWGDEQIGAVLSLTKPSPDALLRLQAALEAEDKPERPVDYLLRERARYVELVWRRYYGSDPNAPWQYALPVRSLGETVARPWFTHGVVGVLRRWAQLVEVMRAPWPERLRRSRDTLEQDRIEQGSSPTTSVLGVFAWLARPSYAVAAFAQAVQPTELIVDRCSRVAVAAERFERDRQTLPGALSDLVPQYLREVPSDPFTGRPLLYRRGEREYAIYSAGPNLRDDGGDIAHGPERRRRDGTSSSSREGLDVGVRVLRHD